MVYDPTVKTQEKDIELWHKAFVHGLNLPDSQARDATTPPLPLPRRTNAEPLLEGSVPHRARRALSSSALAAALAATTCHRLLLHRRPHRLVLHHRPRRPSHLPRRHRHTLTLTFVSTSAQVMLFSHSPAVGHTAAVAQPRLLHHVLAHVARQRGQTATMRQVTPTSKLALSLTHTLTLTLTHTPPLALSIPLRYPSRAPTYN